MSKTDPGEKMRAALSFHRQGNVQQATHLYREIIREDSHNAQALHYLGVIEAGSGNFEQAKSLIARSVAADPKNGPFIENFATICLQSGDYAGALQAAERGLRLNSANASLLYLSAISLIKLSRWKDAQTQFDKLLSAQPSNVIAWNERASVLAELKLYEDALTSVDRALALQPQYAEAHLNKANIFSLLERYDDALAEFEKVLALRSNSPNAWLGRGHVLRERKRYEDAIASYEKALTLMPNLQAAWIGLGKTFMNCGRHAEALAAYNRAAAPTPSAASSLGRGNALAKLRRFDEAYEAYNQALAIDPNYAEAWLSLGNALSDQKRFPEALAAFAKALDNKPDWADVWVSRGRMFVEFKRYDEAFDAFNKAYALQPNMPFLEGERLHAKTHLCDWQDFQAECTHLVSSIDAGRPTAPMALLALPSTPQQQRRCAESYNLEMFPRRDRSASPQPHDEARIRIAYLSADFRDHPVAYLLAGLIENHNRDRFEVAGISFGPDTSSDIRTRFRNSFERFVDVNERSDADVVALLKSLKIDIAVDLMGYTGGSRSGIFAHRPCAMQVNFLGYPGTMGAEYIDYLIADRILIPDAYRDAYSEKIVYLPHSYQPNDSKRVIAGKTPSRAEAGLPEAGFVFCCFNNNYKITPDVFDSWMRILKRVDGSVLWLYQSNAFVPVNLRKEAAARGVDPNRIVFAEPVELPDHLARHRLADLCLDTLPYNAHTTASDALWTGLPIVTRIGETFASRVAASLLNAVGLPEFVTATQEQYEDLAVELATNAAKLAAVKQKLSENRHTHPLFNTRLFATHIEAAYSAMYGRAKSGLPPADISVAQDESTNRS